MADDPKKTDHDQRVKALNEANAVTAKAQATPPTPTQEENDLMALGVMHIDEKDAGQTKDPDRPARPAPEPQSTSSSMATARRS